MSLRLGTTGQASWDQGLQKWGGKERIKKKLSWWNIERQLKAFLFIGYSYSCCALFFLGCYMIKWQWLKMLSPKGLWFSSGGKLLYSFLRTDRGCLNGMIIIMDYVLYTRYCFVWYGTYEAIFPFKFRKVIVITLSLSLSVCLFVCLFVQIKVVTERQFANLKCQIKRRGEEKKSFNY